MKIGYKFIFIFLILALFGALTLAFWLWLKIKSFEPNVFYYVPPEKSFIYGDEELKYGIERYLREAVEKEMTNLIEKKESFVYVDLKNMELSLYKEGEKFKVFPVKAKGAEWFWGQTPPGVYTADFRARLQFSNATRVWMPYAIQYYGNYFIHGWPYDMTGKPISSKVSGGCIRLQT
jgi:lipoprotein-anchoring transpeptidase ErfK/SrfK